MRFYTTLRNINVRKTNDNNEYLVKQKKISDHQCGEWSV